MLPVDHLLLRESAALPAILVVRRSVGQTHFVVVWRRHGPLVQVMDPGGGRIWMTASQLLHDVHVHSQNIPAAAFEAWVRTDEFQSALSRRMSKLKCANASRKLIANAVNEPGWHGLAALDASIRLSAALVRSRGVKAVSDSFFSARGDVVFANLRDAIQGLTAVVGGDRPRLKRGRSHRGFGRAFS